MPNLTVLMPNVKACAVENISSEILCRLSTVVLIFPLQIFMLDADVGAYKLFNLCIGVIGDEESERFDIIHRIQNLPFLMKLSLAFLGQA